MITKREREREKKRKKKSRDECDFILLLLFVTMFPIRSCTALPVHSLIQFRVILWEINTTLFYFFLYSDTNLSSSHPERRSRMSDNNLLSGISGLSFDSTVLSPLSGFFLLFFSFFFFLFFLPSALALSNIFCCCCLFCLLLLLTAHSLDSPLSPLPPPAPPI